MKKLLPLLLCGLLLFSVNAHSQTYWELITENLSISSKSSYLTVSNTTTSSVTLHNGVAESKDEKKKNLISFKDAVIKASAYRLMGDPAKRILFTIDDINDKPSEYKYPVINEKGKIEYTTNLY